MRLGKILAIDGSHMLHRALHIPSLFELKTSYGERTGGIFQFIRSLQYEVKNHQHFPIVCWDAGLAKRRIEIYDNYKHHQDRLTESKGYELSPEEKDKKEEKDEYLDEYRRQRSEIIDFLNIIGVPSIRAYGWEGDDLLYIVSNMSEHSIIVTDDKDLLQLLDETTDVSRAIAKEYWTIDNFLEEHDYEDIQEFIIQKSITGDSSDNIPKVADGAGPVNAQRIAKLVNNSDSPDEYLKELSKSNRKVDQRFINNHDQFLRNLKLIDLDNVKITDNIVSRIEGEISTSIGDVDYFEALKFLGKKEINEIDLDMIVSRFSVLSKNVLKE